jgi:hypothetical protein
MATEKQLDFFRSLYEEESKRAELLGDHAKNNLSLATLYSAFIFFVAEKQPSQTILTKALFLAAVFSMLGAFLLSLWATQIANYEALADPKDILDRLGDAPPTDDDFFDDRIVDYTVAYGRNSDVNDKKAARLQFARYLLLAGIVFHAAYFFVRSF